VFPASDELIDTGMQSSPAPTEDTVVERLAILAIDVVDTSRYA
jgi:hypothetical protein